MRQRFDVTENLEKFWEILGTKQHLTWESIRSLSRARPDALQRLNRRLGDHASRVLDGLRGGGVMRLRIP